MKLNLGCGPDIRLGWWNGDIRARFKSPSSEMNNCVLGTTAWPWHDETVEEILIRHVAEHLPNDVLENTFHEAFRVLQPRGAFTVEVPFYRSFDAVQDPTHVRYFELGSFHHMLGWEPFDLDLTLRILPYPMLVGAKDAWLPHGLYEKLERVADAATKVATEVICRREVRAAQTLVPAWVRAEWSARFTKPERRPMIDG